MTRRSFRSHNPQGSGNPQGPGAMPPRPPRFRRYRQSLAIIAGVGLVGIAGAGVLGWTTYAKLVADLPSVDSLRAYQPPTVSRIYASDDRLMAELANERRIFVPINAIPERVKNAFIATEDHNFYTHGGVDFMAIGRAGLTDIFARHGRRPLGASTITQQVAKVMLLNSNVVSLDRKIKEALLAMKMEQVLSKDKILEIYLNGIYLGNGAYGVAAAAQSYFNKPLDQLDDAEAASLAALPKSPTNYNPFLHPQAAMARRNLVLDLMVEAGVLTRQQADQEKQEPLVPQQKQRFGPLPDSEWFGEEVRRQLIAQYGQDRAAQGGLEVHTSLDQGLQVTETHLLREGLMNYDRVHSGWRGSLRNLPDIQDDGWESALDHVTPPGGMLREWRLAVVLPGGTHVGWIEEGLACKGVLLETDIAWARRMHPLRGGDVIMIEPQEGGFAALRQIPQVEGAAVTLDVHTGRVLAMVGGWSFHESQFNRVTQALRQPGSSFKPFVYLAAMEKGISPSERFDDSPISYGDWHPQNYEHDNWGPTTLHDALRESRNLVTIRVAAHLGMKAVADTAIRAGLVAQMPHVLPAALGAVETTVMREAAAYATIANGGHIVTPTLVDDIQDRAGTVLWQAGGLKLGTAMQAPPAEQPASTDGTTPPAPATAPPTPSVTSAVPLPGSVPVPALTDVRPILASEQSTFQIVKMMQDVIARGTGRMAGVGIDRPIAGKTGTSQDFHDAWFAGFSPDIVTVVWVGFDTPQTLGRNSDGGRVAGPIWNRIMKVALANRPKLDFRVPDGITLASYDTGRISAVDGFKTDQVPGASVELHGFGAGTEALTAADTGVDSVISDSESDMAQTPGHGGGMTGTGSGSSTAVAPGQPQKPAPSDGDIGVGGLY
ncbi:PBP1A family penicillin-binding protein [Gluconobacter sphaericus]|uniref:penicillin-binding protein 1A n=1 Tax=Gluconobacter sphaericus TaxID=574987 RepID=UPI0019238FEE|nr:PBP1A family penicillin-binding protein [Gluconobacter sphaericus]QQX90040.1 PBP1A family penicillin-binding protein [Gluconobacter sphaericus]